MNVSKTIRGALAAGALAGGIVFAAAAPATAAHCNDRGAPGNSDFAEHVRASNGPGGHDEGDHQGYSSCQEQARSGGR